MIDNSSEQLYDVVYNDEGQYSIWPIEKEMPLGWHKEGTGGIKEVCLARIKEIWVDMRPNSLKAAMASTVTQ